MSEEQALRATLTALSLGVIGAAIPILKKAAETRPWLATTLSVVWNSYRGLWLIGFLVVTYLTFFT